jgi:hypothetical protein
LGMSLGELGFFLVATRRKADDVVR